MEVPAIDAMVEAKTERLENSHFDYMLVFGQGPVQEAAHIPTSGREGLNFYGRLIAMAAGEMLKKGITDHVIVSGGQTGARAGTPGAKTEADLMADSIRRHLTRGSRDPDMFMVHGQKKRVSACVLTENEAQDSLQNLAFILNKYLPEGAKGEFAFLGIGFHAHDTFSGANEGRLEVLADLFGIAAPTFSAEGILRRLSQGRGKASFVRRELVRLTHEALSHPVSLLKSQQEAVLVRGLRAGDWKRIAPFLQQGKLLGVITRDSYVMNELQKQFGLSREAIQELSQEELLDRLHRLQVTGSVGYGEAKAAVFQALGAISRATGEDYLGKYGKATVTY